MVEREVQSFRCPKFQMFTLFVRVAASPRVWRSRGARRGAARRARVDLLIRAWRRTLRKQQTDRWQRKD